MTIGKIDRLGTVLEMENEYIHQGKSLVENEIHLILWDFDLQTDHMISVWWPDLELLNKNRPNRPVDFAVLVDCIVKRKRKRKDKRILGLC